ncbi:hypothetical protein ABVN80_10645 [Acinetobacter baumannii]
MQVLNCTGRGGEDVVLKVPVGTTIVDTDSGDIIGDLVEDGQRVMVASGGEGGLGNTTLNHQPTVLHVNVRQVQKVSSVKFAFELKVLADVGLLGSQMLVNQHLFVAVSAAKPKVADYPFTTMVPNLECSRC